jgi:hypothetical protein
MARARKRTTKLNDFAARFADQLFAKYPDWKRHSIAPAEWQSKSDLAVAVPYLPRWEWTLVILTEGDGIKIAWGNWDAHFDVFSEAEGRPDRITDALSVIDDILADRLVIVEYWHGTDAGLTLSVEREKIDNVVRKFGSTVGGTRCTVRSWTGISDHRA